MRQSVEPWCFYTVRVSSLTQDIGFLQEICYLDQVLDAAAGSPTNGSSCLPDRVRPICIDGNAASVCVSASPPVGQQPPVVVQGQRQTTLLSQEDPSRRPNGHTASEDSACSGAKFELRAFQEEKRPAKLFSPGDEQQVRVTRRRPTEEVRAGQDRPSKTTAIKLLSPPVRFRSWSASARS